MFLRYIWTISANLLGFLVSMNNAFEAVSLSKQWT